jgi:hypothetical protein
MAKPHPTTELDQAGLDRGRCRFRIDSEPGGCSPQQRRITERLGRRSQQQSAGLHRKGIDPPTEGFLGTPQRRTGPGSPNPPASCCEVSARGSSSSASGLPRVSAMI